MIKWALYNVVLTCIFFILLDDDKIKAVILEIFGFIFAIIQCIKCLCAVIFYFR